MRYTIKPSSIAAVQYIQCEDGREWDAVYMAEGKPVDITQRRTRRTPTGDNTLPVPVLAAVNKHFEMMFSLPYERRQALIDNTLPLEININEGEATCQEQ